MARGQLAQMCEEVASRVERAARRLRPPRWFHAAPRGFLLGARRPSRLPPWPALDAPDHGSSGSQSAPATLRRRDRQRVTDIEPDSQAEEPCRRDAATLYATPLSSRRVRPESEWHSTPLSRWDSAPPRRHRSQLTLRSASPSLSNDSGWSRSQELRRPYLGWRSQEKLNRRPWTPEERLAASLLQQRASSADNKGASESSTPAAAQKQFSTPDTAGTKTSNGIFAEIARQKLPDEKRVSGLQPEASDKNRAPQTTTPAVVRKHTSPQKGANTTMSNSVYAEITKQGPPDERLSGRLQPQVSMSDKNGAPHSSAPNSQPKDSDTPPSYVIYTEITKHRPSDEWLSARHLQQLASALDPQVTRHRKTPTSAKIPDEPINTLTVAIKSADTNTSTPDNIHEDVTMLSTPNQEVRARLQRQSAVDVQETIQKSEDTSESLEDEKLAQPNTAVTEVIKPVDSGSSSPNSIYTEVIKYRTKPTQTSEGKRLPVRTYYHTVSDSTPLSNKQFSGLSETACTNIHTTQINADVTHQSLQDSYDIHEAPLSGNHRNITSHGEDCIKVSPLLKELNKTHAPRRVSSTINADLAAALRDTSEAQSSVSTNLYSGVSTSSLQKTTTAASDTSASERTRKSTDSGKSPVLLTQLEALSVATSYGSNGSDVYASPHSEIRQMKKVSSDSLYSKPSTTSLFKKNEAETETVQNRGFSTSTKLSGHNNKIPSDVPRNLNGPYTLPMQIKALSVTTHHSDEKASISPNTTNNPPPTSFEDIISPETPRLLRSRTFSIEPKSEDTVEGTKVRHSSPVTMRTRSLEITLPQRLTTNDTSRKLSVEEKFWEAGVNSASVNHDSSLTSSQQNTTPLPNTSSVVSMSVVNVENSVSPLVETGFTTVPHVGTFHTEFAANPNREPFIITQLPSVELSIHPIVAELAQNLRTDEPVNHTDLRTSNDHPVSPTQDLNSCASSSNKESTPLKRSRTFCIDSHHSSLETASGTQPLPVVDDLYGPNDVSLVNNKNTPLAQTTTRVEIAPPSLAASNSRSTELSLASSPLVETSLMTIQIAPSSPVMEYTAVYRESSPLLGRKPFTANYSTEINQKPPLSEVTVPKNVTGNASVPDNSIQSQIRSKIPVPTASKTSSEKNSVSFAPILPKAHSSSQASSQHEHANGPVKQKSSFSVGGGVLRRPSYRVATSVELTPALRKRTITSDFRSDSGSVLTSNPQPTLPPRNKKAPIPKPPRARNKESPVTTPTPPPRPRTASVPQTTQQSFKAVPAPHSTDSVLTNGISPLPYSALSTLDPKFSTPDAPIAVPNSRFHKQAVIMETVSNARQLPDPALLTPLKYKPCTTTDL